MDLDLFFQQWIYGKRYPKYVFEWGWIPDGPSFRVRLSLAQVAGPDPAYFSMPVDFRIYGAGADTTITVLNDAPSQMWTWYVSFAPDSLQLDPDAWILKTRQGTLVNVEDVGKGARTFTLHQNYPNPFNPATLIRYVVPERSQVTLEVTDLLGRRVALLVSGIVDQGSYEASWRPSGATGVYFSRMTAVPVSRPQNVVRFVRKMLYVK